jgi:hypothetical protein
MAGRACTAYSCRTGGYCTATGILQARLSARATVSQTSRETQTFCGNAVKRPTNAASGTGTAAGGAHAANSIKQRPSGLAELTSLHHSSGLRTPGFILCRGVVVGQFENNRRREANPDDRAVRPSGELR